MGKLFAMEELDTEVDAVELETAPEQGEVADVQVDVEQEVAEVAEGSEAIEEGMGAADQLEQVEEVVAAAAEEGEGLDPVAAEAIKIAVEAICARVGANPKAVYALYATENFQSASSRKANTKIALEGVGEFLKDMWKKIKAALARLWEKVRAFWDKHASNLGRVKKAIDSMKKKVGESSGKFDGKAYIEEAPSTLASAFGFEGEITAASIGKVIKGHEAISQKADDVTDTVAKLNAVAATKGADIKALADAVSGQKEGKTKFGPLVGGVTIEAEVEVDKEQGTVNISFEEDTAEVSEKVGVVLGDKSAVKGVLDQLSAIIANDIKVRDKMAKLQESFNKAAMTVEKSINDTVKDKESSEAAKELRKGMKLMYAVNAKIPSLQNKSGAYNIKLAKAVLGYAALCVKNYK